MKGSELVGRTYKPMFPYFSSLKAAPGSDKGAFRVVADGYVTADAGTGVVHQAPFFGEDDYRVCRKFGEPDIQPSSVATCRSTQQLDRSSYVLCVVQRRRFTPCALQLP